jgi:hypothetical protein
MQNAVIFKGGLWNGGVWHPTHAQGFNAECWVKILRPHL